VVRRLITAIGAVAVLGVVTPATARVQEPAFDARLDARLDRSWTWESDHLCGSVSGDGRRTVTIRTAAPVAVGPTGGTIPVVGTLRLASSETSQTGTIEDGSCDELQQTCTPRSTRITGTVRLTIAGRVVRLSQLRYRTRGAVGCARDIPAVRAALPGQPRLERVAARDTAGLLRNPRVRRVTVTGTADPSIALTGELRGTVRAAVDWTLVLVRRST
jgi:hypothetical protein